MKSTPAEGFQSRTLSIIESFRRLSRYWSYTPKFVETTPNYNLGNLCKIVAAVGMKMRSPGFRSGGDSPSAFIGVPWNKYTGVPSSLYFLNT